MVKRIMMVKNTMEQLKYNDHHTAHNKGFWDGHLASRHIRENPSMIAHDLGVTAHNLLHKMTMPVPVPSIPTLQYVDRRLYKGYDVFRGIDEYSRLVEESIKNPRARPLEIELADLSVRALREQIPYLKDFRRRTIIT